MQGLVTIAQCCVVVVVKSLRQAIAMSLSSQCAILIPIVCYAIYVC